MASFCNGHDPEDVSTTNNFQETCQHYYPSSGRQREAHVFKAIDVHIEASATTRVGTRCQVQQAPHPVVGDGALARLREWAPDRDGPRRTNTNQPGIDLWLFRRGCAKHISFNWVSARRACHASAKYPDLSLADASMSMTLRVKHCLGQKR